MPAAVPAHALSRCQDGLRRDAKTVSTLWCHIFQKAAGPTPRLQPGFCTSVPCERDRGPVPRAAFGQPCRWPRWVHRPALLRVGPSSVSACPTPDSLLPPSTMILASLVKAHFVFSDLFKFPTKTFGTAAF